MKYVELWCNNDNNDNTRAGAKYAGCGTETSFYSQWPYIQKKNGKLRNSRDTVNTQLYIIMGVDF